MAKIKSGSSIHSADVFGDDSTKGSSLDGNGSDGFGDVVVVVGVIPFEVVVSFFERVERSEREEVFFIELVPERNLVTRNTGPRYIEGKEICGDSEGLTTKIQYETGRAFGEKISPEVHFAQVLSLNIFCFEPGHLASNLFRRQGYLAICRKVTLWAYAETPLIVGCTMESQTCGEMPPKSLTLASAFSLLLPCHLTTFGLSVKRSVIH